MRKKHDDSAANEKQTKSKKESTQHEPKKRKSKKQNHAMPLAVPQRKIPRVQPPSPVLHPLASPRADTLENGAAKPHQPEETA